MSENVRTQVINLQKSVITLMEKVDQYLKNNEPNFELAPSDEFKQLNAMLEKKLIEHDNIVFENSLAIMGVIIVECIKHCIQLITIKHYEMKV